MELRSTFQSIISLHQEELPFALQERSTQLPLDGNRIVTVTGIRRCGKSSLLGLTINRLLQQGIPKERILYVGFDDERFLSMSPENFDELLQAYREMYPDTSLKDVYMFFDEIQLIEGWELFVLRVYKNYCKHIYVTEEAAVKPPISRSTLSSFNVQQTCISSATCSPFFTTKSHSFDS